MILYLFQTARLLAADLNADTICPEHVYNCVGKGIKQSYRPKTQVTPAFALNNLQDIKEICSAVSYREPFFMRNL